MKSSLEFRKIRDFGEIINDTFVFVFQNWKDLLKAYLIICGILVIASACFSILYVYKITEVQASTSPNSFYSSKFAAIFSFQYLFNILVSTITYNSISLVTIAYITLYAEKENTAPSITEIWGYFKYYFFRVFFSSAFIAFLVGFAFLCCLIPGFYILPAFSLVIPIMVIENTSVGYGIRHAFDLVKGHYWTILGVVIVIYLIQLVLMMLSSLPVTIFTTFSTLLTRRHMTESGLILNSIASHICMVFYMLPPIACCLSYYSLNEQKEGTGLLSRIENLGSTELDEPDTEHQDEEE